MAAVKPPAGAIAADDEPPPELEEPSVGPTTPSLAPSESTPAPPAVTGSCAPPRRPHLPLNWSAGQIGEAQLLVQQSEREKRTVQQSRTPMDMVEAGEDLIKWKNVHTNNKAQMLKFVEEQARPCLGLPMAILLLAVYIWFVSVSQPRGYNLEKAVADDLAEAHHERFILPPGQTDPKSSEPLSPFDDLGDTDAVWDYIIYGLVPVVFDEKWRHKTLVGNFLLRQRRRGSEKCPVGELNPAYFQDGCSCNTDGVKSKFKERSENNTKDLAVCLKWRSEREKMEETESREPFKSAADLRAWISADEARKKAAGECGVDEMAGKGFSPFDRPDSHLQQIDGKFFEIQVSREDFQTRASKDLNPNRGPRKLECYRYLNWIDRHTKEVRAEFFVLAGESGIFSMIQVKWFFTPEGFVRPRLSMNTLDAKMGMSAPGLMLKNPLAPLIMWGVLVFLSIIHEIRRVFHHAKRITRMEAKMKKDGTLPEEDMLQTIACWFWRVFPVFSLYRTDRFSFVVQQFANITAMSIFFMKFVMNIYMDKGQDHLLKYHKDPKNDAKEWDEAWNNLVIAKEIVDIFEIVLAVYALCLMLLFFQAFRAQPRLSIISHTMTGALDDLLHFFIVFIGVFSAFVASAWVLFGDRIEMFTNFSFAFGIAFTALMGDFDWGQMSWGEFGVSRFDHMATTIAGVWFWLYMLCVSLVLLNMLIAILMDSFTKAKENSTGQTISQQAKLIAKMLWFKVRKKDATSTAVKREQSSRGILRLRSSGTLETLEGFMHAVGSKADGDDSAEIYEERPEFRPLKEMFDGSIERNFDAANKRLIQIVDNHLVRVGRMAKERDTEPPPPVGQPSDVVLESIANWNLGFVENEGAASDGLVSTFQARADGGGGAGSDVAGEGRAVSPQPPAPGTRIGSKLKGLFAFRKPPK